MCQQLREFTKNTIGEYNKTIRVKQYSTNNPIEENPQRENYIQIGLRHLIDQEVFDPTTDVYPGILGLTRSIVLGEEQYFVSQILGNRNISPIDVKKKNILPRYLSEIINNWNGSIILSVDFFYNYIIKQNKWWNFIRWDERIPLLAGIYPIFEVSQELVKELENKIIIYDKKKIIWNFVNFHNELLDRDERLQVRIGDLVNNKRDVTIRTVNKMDVDTDFVKILNIIE